LIDRGGSAAAVIFQPGAARSSFLGSRLARTAPPQYFL
jgi:hypothetical protein